MTLCRWERFRDARTVYNQHGNQSQGAVATATGISKSKISDLEKDCSQNNCVPRDVGAFDIAVLAKYYGVTTDYLLGLTNDPNPKPTATDELGFSPAAISKIMWHKKVTADDFDAIAVLSHLLENNDIWNLLFSIDDYADAVKAELICETIIKQQATASGIIDLDASILKLREKAEEYGKTNIGIHDYLIVYAHNISSNSTLCDTLGYLNPYDIKLTDLCSYRLNQMLSGILRDIQRECCNGND